jgi:hypothetical protein
MPEPSQRVVGREIASNDGDLVNRICGLSAFGTDGTANWDNAVAFSLRWLRHGYGAGRRKRCPR